MSEFSHTDTLYADLYYQAFPNDRWFTKCLVYTVYALQLAETVATGVDAFRVFGYGFGDFGTLTRIDVASFISPLITAISTESHVPASDANIPFSFFDCPIFLCIPPLQVLRFLDPPSHHRDRECARLHYVPIFHLNPQVALAVSICGFLRRIWLARCGYFHSIAFLWLIGVQPDL